MAINSREKGKRIERQAVRFLQSLGFPDARRTAQVRGKTDGCADVECPESLPHVHFEVKGDERIDLGTKALDAAWEQAFRDAGPTDTPVLLWRRKGRKYFCLTKATRHGGHTHRITLDRWPDIQQTLNSLRVVIKEPYR